MFKSRNICLIVLLVCSILFADTQTTFDFDFDGNGVIDVKDALAFTNLYNKNIYLEDFRLINYLCTNPDPLLGSTDEEMVHAMNSLKSQIPLMKKTLGKDYNRKFVNAFRILVQHDLDPSSIPDNLSQTAKDVLVNSTAGKIPGSGLNSIQFDKYSNYKTNIMYLYNFLGLDAPMEDADWLDPELVGTKITNTNKKESSKIATETLQKIMKENPSLIDFDGSRNS